MPETLLQFFDELTKLNDLAHTSDETAMWVQHRKVDEMIAPYGYKLVSYADGLCFVAVQNTVLHV